MRWFWVHEVMKRKPTLRGVLLRQHRTEPAVSIPRCLGQRSPVHDADGHLPTSAKLLGTGFKGLVAFILLSARQEEVDVCNKL